MLYTLVIWTVVAGWSSNAKFTPHELRDWRPLTAHSNLEACEDAARKLGYAPGTKYRCIKN